LYSPFSKSTFTIYPIDSRPIVPEINRYKKIFGVGPSGAIISFLLLTVALFVDRRLGCPKLMNNPVPLRCIALTLIGLGLYLHSWAFFTLRNWWRRDSLCTKGPFRYLRHPMYSAWITFVSFGFALILNSWIILFWSIVLHPIWHLLVVKEEKMLENIFGSQYRKYSSQTGRFIPKFLQRRL
jgi:protein-S-isoprenylcysteine O-methyltransferase Ste14